jgi:1-acyl-sn-glycerol-3-phosphate acyltransferase
LVLIRSLIYFVLMVLTILLFGLTLALFGWLMPMSWRHAIGNGWGRTNLWLQKAVCALTYNISGMEHIPAGGAIIMSKHQSSWETISLRGLLPRNQAWVLKQELMWVPVFGWALAAVKPIAIDRKAGRKAMKQVVEQGIACLAEGRNVIIFPEGTRTAPGERRRYNPGGGLLAAKAGVSVIPIAHNAGVFWARRGLKKHPGTIQMVVGEPISTVNKSAGDIMAEVEAWIEGVQETLPKTLEEAQNQADQG